MHPSSRPLLIMKTGSVLPEADIGTGDFEHWFTGLLGPEVTTRTMDVRKQLPESPSHYAGVVVTGSPAMVSDRADWSEAAAAWLGQAVKQGIPVLGVCFGHQLLAHALGGEVGDNPRGRQMGTQKIQLLPTADDDPLLKRVPKTFTAQTSHQQAVLKLPTGAVCLASSPRDPNHAFRFGATAWGIQFHPEFSADTTRAYIQARRGPLRDSGQDPDVLLSEVADTPVAAGLLAHFSRLARMVEAA